MLHQNGNYKRVRDALSGELQRALRLLQHIIIDRYLKSDYAIALFIWTPGKPRQSMCFNNSNFEIPALEDEITAVLTALQSVDD